jgi:Spy/CpxP family protein refolding chaperone
MMSKWKTWACGGALATAAAMSMAAWSMEPSHGMGGDPARMIAYLSDRLDLSAEQQTEVDSLALAAKQGSDADRARMNELRSQMLAMKGNFDPGTAQSVADEIGQLTGRMVYRASETFARVYQVLNSEQRTELDSMMAKHGERGGRRGYGGDKPE